MPKKENKKNKIFFIGGGRLAGILYAAFHDAYNIVGYIDDMHYNAYLSQTYGVPCLGTSDTLKSLESLGAKAVIAITDTAAREKYFYMLEDLGFELATLIFPTTVIADNAEIGVGCIIRHQAIISPKVCLGKNCVVSDNAYVGHDTIVGDHVYISPGVNINGSVTIGNGTFIGTGAIVLPERKIASGCTIGAAACVTIDVEDDQKVVGVPARPIGVSRPVPENNVTLLKNHEDPKHTIAADEKKPLVSVLMASYNHEKYVAEAIQSVLDQTFQDYEMIIVDDGSTDKTVQKIKLFNDPRIQFLQLNKNYGLAVAKNYALENARGKYIAILNSDDAFMPEKLEKQVKYLQAHPEIGAVFSYVTVIDDDGNHFQDHSHPYFKVFEQPNRSRQEWLRHFFYYGNCLCAPSAVMPRCYIKEIGYLDKRYKQLPDLDLWIRLCLKHPIHIYPEKLTRFRVHYDESNASGLKPEGWCRGMWEYVHIFQNYLNINHEQELISIFPETVKYLDIYAKTDKDTISYIIARLALDTKEQRLQVFALETLHKLLGNEHTADRIYQRFRFSHKDFIQLTGQLDIFKVVQQPATHDRI